MIANSKHPEVGLWSYEGPSRGYRGLHLRAKNSSARRKLRETLASLVGHRSLWLEFGSVAEETPKRWARNIYKDVQVSLGLEYTEFENTLSLAIEETELAELLDALESLKWHEEISVMARVKSKRVPLWLWWDVE